MRANARLGGGVLAGLATPCVFRSTFGVSSGGFDHRFLVFDIGFDRVGVTYETSQSFKGSETLLYHQLRKKNASFRPTTAVMFP